MPTSPPKVSVVIPVRNVEHRIATEIPRVLETLVDLSRQRCEVIVVDDASSDSTPELLDELVSRFPQVKVWRNGQPMGIEAAGHRGLEWASGEIIFIQEDNLPIRLEDMRRLFSMSEDQSVVVARAESMPRRPSGALLRRMHAWGTDLDHFVSEESGATGSTALQMIRRPHLQHLRGPQPPVGTLRSDVVHLTSVH